MAGIKLNEKGQCPECGIKPLVYKRSAGPGHPSGKFCHRCDRSYDFDSGEQQDNWAWMKTTAGVFERRART